MLLATSLLVAVTAAEFPPYELADHPVSVKAAIAGKLELKRPLKLGIIKLTDCAPIVIAKEMGYFAAEGLTVEVVVQPNWQAVRDNLINGGIDGSHMLYGHPLGTAVGAGAKADLVAPYNISVNGMGISVSNELWSRMTAADPSLATSTAPVTATTLRQAAASYRAEGKTLTMFMTYPAGSHNINLRYWLGAGGVHPGFYDGPDDAKGVSGAEVLLQVNPPPQMVSAMNQGNCQGFCVGEPWNMKLVLGERSGRLAIASHHVYAGSPDKVFGMTKAFTEQHPNTTRALVKALIRAGRWLDQAPEHRVRLASILAHKAYIGADAAIIAESITGTLAYSASGDAIDRRPEPEFNKFYKDFSSFPFRSHAVWGLTQMRRWGMIGENKPDAWYQEVAAATFRTDLYRDAFAALQRDGLVEAAELPAEDSRAVPGSAFIDGIAFNPAQPNAYIAQFAMGRK
jgi:nitrate/nitrite transport system substrate-binding protein